MNSEAQNTQSFPVAQALSHERFHADFFHVGSHFKFILAEIAQKIGDPLLVRLQGLSAKTICLVRAAVHARRVHGAAVGRNREDVAGQELPTLVVYHVRPLHLFDLVHRVGVAWVEGSFKNLRGQFLAEGPKSPHPLPPRLDELCVFLHVLSSTPS